MISEQHSFDRLCGADMPVRLEAATISRLFVAAFYHLASDNYRRDDLEGGCFSMGNYRIDIIPIDLYPDILAKTDLMEWALLRVSCRHPFYSFQGTQALIASMPGIEVVRQNNLTRGKPRHEAWKRVKTHSLTFGFDAALDISNRSALAVQLNVLEGDLR